MTMEKGNRFKRGSGCYRCQCCKRLTRATGRGDNEWAELCAECYEIGGLMNSITDKNDTPEVLAGYQRRIEELEAIVRSKGGV